MFNIANFVGKQMKIPKNWAAQEKLISISKQIKKYIVMCLYNVPCKSKPKGIRNSLVVVTCCLVRERERERDKSITHLWLLWLPKNEPRLIQINLNRYLWCFHYYISCSPKMKSNGNISVIWYEVTKNKPWSVLNSSFNYPHFSMIVAVREKEWAQSWLACNSKKMVIKGRLVDCWLSGEKIWFSHVMIERERKRTNEPFNMKYCDFFSLWCGRERAENIIECCFMVDLCNSYITYHHHFWHATDRRRIEIATHQMFRFLLRTHEKNSQNNFFFSLTRSLALWLHDMANVWSIWEVGMRQSFSHNLVYLLQRRRIFLTLLRLSHSILLDSFCSNHQQR